LTEATGIERQGDLTKALAEQETQNISRVKMVINEWQP
jgi:hypothetical protein